jgi:hypothetical protein
MNGMSTGNRRESMFHSITEEQFSTATTQYVSLCLIGSSEFCPNGDTFPHFAQYEKANPT